MTELIYSLSQLASDGLASLADILPVGYAFGAGMVSTVNPCGFALLPAYLGLYLGRDTERFAQAPAWRRASQALLVAAAVSAGFVVLFGLAGLAIAATGTLLIRTIPWVGLVVGLLLAAAGIWQLSGRSLYSGLAERLAARMGDPRRGGVRGFFGFGLAYGTASLSCTLPIFLTVVGSGLAVQGFAAAAAQFVSYALGMGLVISALTLGMALFSGAVVGPLRRTLLYFRNFSAALLVLAGAYIVYYWLSVGQLGQTLFS